MTPIRRVAAHEVVTPERVFAPGVVELEAGRVVDVYSLVGEQASTEWLGGVITVENGDDRQPKAYYKGKPIK